MSETTHICSLQVLPAKYGRHVKGLAFMHTESIRCAPAHMARAEYHASLANGRGGIP